MGDICVIDMRRMVPLSRVVAASVTDSYEDIGFTQHRYSHWAARGLKKLSRQVLKLGGRKATLFVNRNTNTATLPPDFHEETGVFFLDPNGKKIALKPRSDLADTLNIENIECEDKCEKCQQDKAICNDLEVSESVTVVNVNGSLFEQKVTKKLYPDGKYFLETRIPVWDVNTSSVAYVVQKEFITEIDLKPCGCIEESDSNIEKIKCNCPDVYCSYFAPCDNSCTENYGGYTIFEESGLIQFDNIGSFKKVYIEYTGYMPKKNGQYLVPEVAFEPLVEWTKYKSVQNRRNIPQITKDSYWLSYDRERKNMEKEIGRVSLSTILFAALSVPKFDIDIAPWEYICSTTVTTPSSQSVIDDMCNTAGVVCPTGVGSSEKIFTPFDIAVVAGNGAGTPVEGVNTYQNDKLIGALGVNMIIVNNVPETIAGGQFTINLVTGTITRIGNTWFNGDVLIVPTFFKLI